MKLIDTAPLERNEHGNLAWGCRCSCWNVPSAAQCWRCLALRPAAILIPSTPWEVEREGWVLAGCAPSFVEACRR